MNTIALAIGSTILLYFLLIHPFLGKKIYLKLKKENNSRARINFYKQTLLMEWLAFLGILLFLTINHNPLKSIGLVFNASTLKIMTTNQDFLTILSGATIWLVVIYLLHFIYPKGTKNVFDRFPKGDYDAMIPANYHERLLWAFCAVTAGICEESIFRGFVFLFLSLLFPHIPTLTMIVISSIYFGIIHYYQGISGMVGVAIVGALFAVLYVSTGSIIPGIIIHSLVDLKLSFPFFDKLLKA